MRMFKVWSRLLTNGSLSVSPLLGIPPPTESRGHVITRSAKRGASWLSTRHRRVEKASKRADAPGAPVRRSEYRAANRLGRIEELSFA